MRSPLRIAVLGLAASPALFSAVSAHWTARSLLLDPDVRPRSLVENGPRNTAAWNLTQPGTTGVAAMQMVVISPTQLLILDRAEHNPLQVDGHNAWSSVYSLTTNSVRPVRLQTNSFCAGGSWLSNGTLVSIGGNVVEHPDTTDKNGAQGLRLFNPSACSEGSTGPCSFYESPTRLHTSVRRWYPGIVRLPDGAAFVVGGASILLWENNATYNVPSYEFWPPRNIHGHDGTAIPSKFLVDSLNANLFPIVILLPSGKLFIAANKKAMIYDWKRNVEIRLPDLPNGVRVSYPMAGVGLLLPLSPADGYTPTVLICGGSTSSDKVDSFSLSSQDPTSAQCVRMTLSLLGVLRGWQVEKMPIPRVMADAVLLPDGRVVIMNGAKTGYQAYDTVQNTVGSSNSDHPAFQAVLYEPMAPAGRRFSTSGIPASNIARMYHSVATLLPSGAIAIAGSNPNPDVVTAKYQTEYRLEVLSPPYVAATRPTFTGVPAKALWGRTLALNVTLPPGTKKVEAALLDLGFSTHGQHMDMRHVWLKSTWKARTSVQVTLPPNANIYPPGPAWLFILADGVPSEGTRLIVGTGAGPRVDEAAWANMLAKSTPEDPNDQGP